ncbi:MAG: PAS domain-containing sensor histidine kinase [Spirochaetota bacterium]
MSTAEASRPDGRTIADDIAIYMDDLSLPFVSLALDATVVAANRAWLEMVGAESGVVGRPFMAFVADADAPRFSRCFAELLEEGRVHRSRFRLASSDGTERTCEFDATLRRDDAGRPLQTLCFCRDSGESAQTRRRLEERERQLDILLRHAPAIIYEFRLGADDSASLDFISPNAEFVTGRPADELADPERVLDHVHPDDRGQLVAEIHRSRDNLAELHHEYRAVRPDGRTARMRTRSVPRREPDGSIVWSGVTLDVTAGKDAGRALERARENERSQAAREIHDALGQSLTAVGFDLEWILRHNPPPEVSQRVGRVLRQIDTLSDEVRRIGAMLRPRILDDLGIAAALEWLGSDASNRYGIKTHVSVPDAIECDDDTQTQLFRIAQEALTNATRHSGAARVEVTLREERGTLVLTIADDGRGFVGAPSPSTGGIAGMRERARNAGGSLEIESGAGRGTTVRASLPSGGSAP